MATDYMKMTKIEQEIYRQEMAKKIEHANWDPATMVFNLDNGGEIRVTHNGNSIEVFVSRHCNWDITTYASNIFNFNVYMRTPLGRWQVPPEKLSEWEIANDKMYFLGNTLLKAQVSKDGEVTLIFCGEEPDPYTPILIMDNQGGLWEIPFSLGKAEHDPAHGFELVQTVKDLTQAQEVVTEVT